jgi:ABC-type polysaccharide/polyol phosphate transport system ATPase subunit
MPHDAALDLPLAPMPLRERRGPVVIEVRDVRKTFRIPTHKVDTLKERVVRPLAQAEYRELRALRGVSFDVRQGEFFGIVGRNGSGKSTLLKILSSIYRADAGRVRMAGRLAPFIELGVGFNPDLTARENVALNGVLMGLGRRQAAAKLDSVLEFSELREFADLKLKNYSSGMLVRLAFAVMVEADADVMLIDEVLAVGDAAFAQKCMDVFREKRKAGKTVVLVTHDMAMVQHFCDRAMLLHDGEVQYLGDPEEAALRYYRLNFGGAGDGSAQGAAGGSVPDVNVRIVDAWLEDADGERVQNVEQGDPIRIHLVAEARRDLEQPVFDLHCVDANGKWVYGLRKPVVDAAGRPVDVGAGERVHITGAVENVLVPGQYSWDAWISRNLNEADLALHVVRLIDFLVYGTGQGTGSVLAEADVEAFLEQEIR